jgi:RNA polymerase-binding transcription factor DksA
VDTEGARQRLLTERERLLTLEQATARLVDEDVDGRPIPGERLEAVPAARHRPEDQTRLERRAA